MAIELIKQSPSLGDSSLGRLFARVRIEQVQDLCEEGMMGNKAEDNIDDLQCALQERSSEVSPSSKIAQPGRNEST
jgi:hypothetical protein